RPRRGGMSPLADPDSVALDPAAPQSPGRAPRSRSAAEAFDFPRRTAAPTIYYIVASTPRSGSTFLCRRLWSTGLMGAPAEYFNYQGFMLQMVARLRSVNIFHYVRQLFAIRTSPNGVFGAKVHFNHFRFMAEAEIQPLFPQLRVVYIAR